MTSPVLSICLSCTMYRPDDPSHCAAFPDGDGIPDNILLRLYDHRRPYPGDHGVRFELDEAREPMLESYDEVIAMNDSDGDGSEVHSPIPWDQPGACPLDDIRDAIKAAQQPMPWDQPGLDDIKVWKAQFDPSKHPRGQPSNAGEFGPGGGGAGADATPPPIHAPLDLPATPPALIAPHLSDPVPNPSGRGGAPVNWQATHFASLPAPYQKKILHNVLTASPNHLTPEMMHANLSATYDHAMSHHWEIPDGGKDADGHWADGPDSIALAGKDWYRKANQGAQKTASLGGIDLHHAIGMVAAMSPQTDWDSNIAMANFTASKLKADAKVSLPPDEIEYRHRQSLASKGDAHDVTIPNGKRLSEMSSGEAAWALYAMAPIEGLTNGILTIAGKPKKAQLSMGAQNVAKAIDIYRGTEPDKTLSGHKVRSFFNNISDPEDLQGHNDVTVDTHMVSAATGYRVTASGATIKKMFEAGGAVAANVKGAYALFADAIREVAKEKGVTPDQAQAIIWTHWQTVKGGHHGYREDFPEIEGDVPPKTEKVKAKERESKARAVARAAAVKGKGKVA